MKNEFASRRRRPVVSPWFLPAASVAIIFAFLWGAFEGADGGCLYFNRFTFCSAAAIEQFEQAERELRNVKHDLQQTRVELDIARFAQSRRR